MFKTICSLTFFYLLLLSACKPKTSTEQSEMTDTEVGQMVREAYFHTFPIVENYKAMYAYSIDTSSPKYLPMNTLYNSAVLYSPRDKFVVSPNNDTYYSTANLDLRAEPVILKVPAVKDRYYSFQLTSMVTDNFGYIGINTTGNDSGTYAITSPNFQGSLPEGVREIKSPSEIIGVIGRTAVNVDDPSDVVTAKAVQAQYQLAPIRKFYPDFPARSVEPLAFPSYQSSDMENERYFSLLNFLLQFIKLTPDETRIMEKFKSIGVEAGNPYTFFTENPQYQSAILSGISQARKDIDSSSRKMGRVVNGWTMSPLGEYFGSDYATRTNMAKIGIYANSPFEAYYPMAFVDSNGQVLDGRNQYSVTFKQGALPPVKFFWSLTMYDNATQLLVENPINRYSIGDRTKSLKKDPDGSLTIFLGHEKPKQGTGNWLPAPKGGFNVMLRLYGPDSSILKGSWTPPAIVKVQ